MLKLKIEITYFLFTVALTEFTFSRKVKKLNYVKFGKECTPTAKTGVGPEKKNMTLGVRFQNLREAYYQWRGAKFSKRARFSRATMFFCQRVISVAPLLLIIHIIIMYIVK